MAMLGWSVGFGDCIGGEGSETIGPTGRLPIIR
jgi:hypothetical protein